MTPTAQLVKATTMQKNMTTVTGGADDPDGSTLAGEVTLEDVNRLRQVILSHRPVIKNIVSTHGQTSVASYIASYMTKPLASPLKNRQAECIAAIKAEIAERLGDEIAESSAKQLEQYYYASTTDHYGPLHHPWVLNFNLLTAGAYLADPNPVLKNIITLACSNVSLNNFSFPRGISFTTPADTDTERHRLSFLPSNSHSFPVYGFRPYTQDDIKKMKAVLAQHARTGVYTKDVADRVSAILDEVYGTEDVLACVNYADQVTLTNYRLWNKLCPPTAEKNINFVYIEQEWVVARLMMEHHLTEKTILNQLLFDNATAEKFIRIFNEVPEAFSTENKRGTYLFWYVMPECKKHRLRLWREGNFLVTDDGKYKVELTPETIRKGIESGELMPSVLLTFLTLACYYGLTCLGGMGQTGYLPKIKDGYIALNKELGLDENIRGCEQMYPSYLGGEMTVAFLDGPHKIFAPATSFDLLLYGTEKTFHCILEKAKKLTLEEALDPMLPEDYPMHYQKKDMDPVLARISPRAIAKLTGIDERIAACAHL